MALFFLAVFFVLVAYLVLKGQYEKTEYYHQTRNSYINVLLNKGLRGEFNTYKCLKSLKGYKRYLFNLYLPKGNGETTELDVVLLHESGIYVFESKNYSGWIFGTESQQYWTQTLQSQNGRPKKTQFFNPILQNKGHLKWLLTFLADQTLPFYSYIVFSDHCELKNITLTTGNHHVVKCCQLLSAVRQNIAMTGVQLSSEKIDILFEKLSPLTQIDEARKAIHIKNITQKKQKSASKLPSSAATGMRIGESVCPRCGGKLVIRTAAKGDQQGKRFLGCTNFPKCRYIKNLP